MLDLGKWNVLGVMVDAIDYEAAIDRIVAAAKGKHPLAISALASHGVMTGWLDLEQRFRLNQLDLVVPDGHPVRHALRLLYGIRLPDRVYGPRLMLEVCKRAERLALPVYMYGSTNEVVERLNANLERRFPALMIVGAEPSQFRRLSRWEKEQLIARIRESRARIVFVGLGCPRQETWAYEMRSYLSIPLLAVGAAFEFHAGTASQAPSWMQDHSLEWLYRLTTNPKRLWKRYLGLGPLFSGLVLSQAIGLHKFDPSGHAPENELSFG